MSSTVVVGERREKRITVGGSGCGSKCLCEIERRMRV